MPRSNLKLTYIENAAARKVTYKKRVKGLLKKTNELIVLCDVQACTIVYSPFDETNPVSWPPIKEEAKQVLLKAKARPDFDQAANRKFTQETFLDDSAAKSEEKIERIRRRNGEYSMQNVMLELLEGKPVEQVPYDNTKELTWAIEDRMRAMQHRISVLEGTNPGPSSSNPPGN